MLRQKSRPYLFSNSIAPSVVGAAIGVFDLISKNTHLRDTLERNTKRFRQGMKSAGFIISGDDNHPIAPVKKITFFFKFFFFFCIFFL